MRFSSILDRAAQESPLFGKPADRWKRGGVEDDTLFLGPFIWAVYEHKAGEPLEAAWAWIEDFAENIRSTGMDVQIGQPS